MSDGGPTPIDELSPQVEVNFKRVILFGLDKRVEQGNVAVLPSLNIHPTRERGSHRFGHSLPRSTLITLLLDLNFLPNRVLKIVSETTIGTRSILEDFLWCQKANSAYDRWLGLKIGEVRLRNRYAEKKIYKNIK